MAKNRDPRRSSIAVGGEEKKRGLLPLILGLLALLILAAIIIGLVSCGKDDKMSSASTPTASAPAPTPSASTPAATPPTGATGSGASLTGGSASVLGADAAGIADHVGDPATGAGLEVLSVVESGFFVGTDESDRQYVEYGGKVGADETDMKLPAVGDVVALSGEVRPAPKSPASTLKLEQADAMTVSARGAYVNAMSVTPAG